MQTFMPKNALVQMFYYYLTIGLASAVFGTDVCADFTSVNLALCGDYT
jgi:hypothetical protein